MAQPSSPVQLIASLREGAWFNFYNDDRLLGTFAGGHAVVFKPTNSVSSRTARLTSWTDNHKGVGFEL